MMPPDGIEAAVRQLGRTGVPAAEHWDIFDCTGSDNGPLQLQRDDDFAEVWPGGDPQVWRHVAGRAAEGSRPHQLALAIAKCAPQERLAITTELAA